MPVYLELDEYDFRTRQAGEYIKFADADDTTRSAVIGGMMNWAGNVTLSIDNNQCEIFSVMRSTRAMSHLIVSK